MALVVLGMVGSVIYRIFNKDGNFWKIMSVITMGSFMTWVAGVYDRVSNYKVLNSFEKHGLIITRYTVRQRMLATSAVIASTFYTIVFMFAAFIAAISNADVLNSVLKTL